MKTFYIFKIAIGSVAVVCMIIAINLGIRPEFPWALLIVVSLTGTLASIWGLLTHIEREARIKYLEQHGAWIKKLVQARAKVDAAVVQEKSKKVGKNK